MTARIGAPKTGGRKRGSIDREARKVLTDQMAGDIMAVYRKLGGVKWLLKFATENPTEFVRQALSRTFPAPQRDDPDVQVNTQINFDSGDNTVEAARRIAFILASGIHPDPSRAIEIEGETIITPQAACDWRDPIGQVEPEPVDDPDRQRWASELALTPEERQDRALVRDTLESDISTYHGSSAEHGGCSVRPRVERDPRAAQRDRLIAAHRRRKDDLL